MIGSSTPLHKDGLEDQLLFWNNQVQPVPALPLTTDHPGPVSQHQAEKESLLFQEFGTSAIAYPRDKTIVALFESHAVNNPDKVALVYENRQLTYRELNEKANQLAHYLKSQGMKAESLVPLCMERSLEMIIGLVGILKAGAAYVPIDPAYPQERIRYVLEDTRASVLITNQVNSAKLREIQNGHIVVVDDDILNSQPVHNPATHLFPQNLVYVIYTSGSTGTPKGVMIEHGNLLDHCFGMIGHANLHTCTSFALTSPLIFDAGHSMIHACFVLSATLHILPEEVLMDGEKVSAYLKNREVDCMKIVPSLWLSYVDEQKIALPGKVLVFGGEPFSAAILALLSKAGYSGEVYNHYGPTETTIGKCIYRVDLTRTYSNIPIGKPFGNTQLYIVGRNFQPVPIGEPGELCIAGEGVSRGYLNRPDLTAEKFVSNPFSADKQARMYRTGDLARWLPDGTIEYLGRMDEQVKIRGFRIELGEIESVLQQYPQVRQVAVVAKADKAGNTRLVAFVVAQGLLSQDVLAAYLRTRLPEYMMPAQLIQQETLPLTLNGKVDKKALLQLAVTALADKPYQTPRTAEEQQLVHIWQRLLGIETIGIDDSFFALGGHSLLAMRMVAAVRKELKKEFTIQDLFSYPTIAQLSGKLQQTIPPAFQAGIRPAFIPLSYNQQSLWFIHQFKGSVPYHIPLVFRLEGSLDEKALEMALQEIVNRHEVLRTVILEKEALNYQKILAPGQWQLHRIQGTDALAGPEVLQQAITQFIETPFDLGRDHMLRASLIRLTHIEYMLVLTLHHIASDGWSLSVFLQELTALYQAYHLDKPDLLAPLSLQYAEYALWQRMYLPEVLEEKMAYWKNKLQNISPLQLPTDLPRPALQSTKGERIRFELNHTFLKPLQLLCRQQEVSLFMCLLSAYKVLLYRYSSQEDICVGTPVAGRDNQETESLIGFFVNSLPLRTHLTGQMSFTELLKAVRTTTLEAFEHGQVPFEKIVEALVPERDVSHNPVFDHCFVLQNVPQESLQLSALQVTDQALPHHTSKFDLTFQFTETGNGLEGIVEYCTDLYKPDTIERMIGQYTRLLQAIIADPSQKVSRLPLLSAGQEALLLHAFNQKRAVYPPNKTIVDLFEAHAMHTPEAIAVVFEESQLTYKQLDAHSNRLAHYLRKKGVEAETLVPICMERSPEMIIGILGILKAGAAYVPIDPTYPQERINYVLEDTHASVVVCNRETKTLFTGNTGHIIDLDNDWAFIQEEYEKNPATLISPHHLAYVIYTSGSTGKPKGVMIEHRGLVTSTLARQSYYHRIESVLLIPSFAFDSSVAVIFGALATGGKLILCSIDAVKDAGKLTSLLKQTEAILCVPSYYRFLLEEKLVLGSALTKVIVAGENLEESLVNMHFTLAPHIHLYNEYGPTECTVWASVAKIEPSTQKITIGKPIENTSIYMLSKDGELNPVGIPGELCIAGEGVSRGYLNRPDLTAEKFVSNPFSADKQERMYRTGDLARWLPDGNIEYLGRMDEQVKIRGFRIELGEIESVLQQYESIRQAVVAARTDKQGHQRLVAFVVAEENFDREKAVNFLKAKLPEHMIPRLWVEMDRLPLNVNGKVNRKALPEIDSSLVPHTHYQAPQTLLEKQVAAIWQQVLGVEQISRQDDFFELGGNSLTAMRIYAEIKRTTGLVFSLSAVFAYPTLSDFALRLQTVSDATQWDSLVTIRPEGTKPALYFVHDAFGDIEYAYRLATFLRPDRPMYGLLALGANGVDTPLQRMEDLVEFHTRCILSHQPDGPYHLISNSLGGNLVHAIACRLAAIGKKVGLVVIFDAYPINHSRFSYRRIALSYVLRSVANFFLAKDISFRYKYKAMVSEIPELIRFNLSRIKSRLGEEQKKRSQPKHMEPREKIFLALKQATDNYRVQPFPGQMIFFRAKENTAKYLLNSDFGWKHYARGGIHVYDLPGNHRAILREKTNLENIASVLAGHLDKNDLLYD